MNIKIFASLLLRDVLAVCPSPCHCYGQSVDCSSKNLKAIPKAFPYQTKRLDLSNNQIPYINELPDSLDELVFLDLSHNVIRDIHYDAFDGLDSLETLNLAHNMLNEIEDDIFQWNPVKLKSLDLSSNKFEFIQHFLFYDLQDIQEINLSNNQLFFIHPHAFDGLDQLRTINLQHNDLSEFKAKWFSSNLQENLMEIMLDNNPWSCDCDLENESSFLNNKSLVKFMNAALNKGQSKLECGDGDSKNKGLNMLEWETLKNKLSTCHIPTITGISKASSVDSGKMLLLKCIASGVPKPVIEWRAPNNEVYRLQSEDFEGVTVHQDGQLLLEDIRKADEGVYHCIARNSKGANEATTKITVIGTDRDDLPSRTDYFDDESDDWKWEDDQWEQREGDYTYEENVGILDNKGNVFDRYEQAEVDHAPKSTKEEHFMDDHCIAGCDCSTRNMDCSNMKNSDVGHAFSTIPSSVNERITHLDLTHNNITKIPYGLCKYQKQLVELKVDENHINTIERSAFIDCLDMRILTLRDNRLEKITPEMFVGLDNVQILVLDHNFLTTLPDLAFAGLDNVEYLYLKNNRISRIEPTAFNGLRKLKFIHLEDNKIDHLDIEWVKEATTNTKLERIFLDGNSLTCDTRLKPFQAHFKDTKYPESRIYKVIQPEEIKCTSPPKLTGKTLIEIEYKELEQIVIVEELSIKSGSKAGMMFGGVFLGVILAAIGFMGWRQWNRGTAMRGGYGYSYTDITQTQGDSEHRALTSNQDSEAYI